MSPFFAFLLLLLFTATSYSQEPVFKVIYRTQLTTTAPVSFEADSKIEDSLLLALARNMLEDMRKKGFRAFLRDSLVVYRDSTVIFTTNIEGDSKPGVNVRVNQSDTIVYYKLNRFYTIYPNKGRHYFQDSTYTTFYDSGKKEKFMNYDTRIFVSADSSETIWLTNKLPASINPRVRIKNPQGAILKYVSKRGNDTVVSEIERIERTGVDSLRTKPRSFEVKN